MGKVIVRPETGKLRLDFRYQGIRCREQMSLPDTPANRRKLNKMLETIQAEIKLGVFEYRRYFPNSKMASKFPGQNSRLQRTLGQVSKTAPDGPILGVFAWEWFEDHSIQWKRSYREGIRGILEKRVIPYFGEKEISRISKAEILKFRSMLAKADNGSSDGLSADRINHIMAPLRMMMADAADRFNFTTPFLGIKALHVPRTDVDPFTLEEVRLFLESIRPDFLNYYTVRFFTGMRTSEIDGLLWKNVDFTRKEILIRDTLVDGTPEKPKTDGSQREIQMSTRVFEALQGQSAVTGALKEYVFCTRTGSPLDYRNVARRVWIPTLKLLDLKVRRPYQTRHTAATLWLAAGENPEWIARQMGHSTTKMLFTVYSRFVPNLTRKDGSAFERMLLQSETEEVASDED